MIRTLVLMALMVLALGGCGSSSPTHTFEIREGGYAAAFDAAREVLREGRFALDRVDANEGVLTTQPKQTSGFATPWDSEQTALSQELEDTVHAQQRRVRITFVASPPDGRALEQSACVGRVEVTLSRVQLVGWQPSSKAILQSGFTTDPVAQANGRDARYEVPIARDDGLASRIAARIRDRLGATPPDQAPNR